MRFPFQLSRNSCLILWRDNHSMKVNLKLLLTESCLHSSSGDLEGTDEIFVKAHKSCCKESWPFHLFNQPVVFSYLIPTSFSNLKEIHKCWENSAFRACINLLIMFLTAEICRWKRQETYKTLSDTSLPGTASGFQKKENLSKEKKKVLPNDLDMATPTTFCICLWMIFFFPSLFYT